MDHRRIFPNRTTSVGVFLISQGSILTVASLLQAITGNIIITRFVQKRKILCGNIFPTSHHLWKSAFNILQHGQTFYFNDSNCIRKCERPICTSGNEGLFVVAATFLANSPTAIIPGGWWMCVFWSCWVVHLIRFIGRETWNLHRHFVCRAARLRLADFRTAGAGNLREWTNSYDWVGTRRSRHPTSPKKTEKWKWAAVAWRSVRVDARGQKVKKGRPEQNGGLRGPQLKH